MKMRYKSYFFSLFVILSITGNILLFILLKSYSTQNHIQQNKYPLLASSSIYLNYPNNSPVNILPLRQQIDKEVKSYKDTFALYFEYLPTSTTFEINGDSEFTELSLMKVPAVMAYFHNKERLGITRDSTVSIKASELNDLFGLLYKKGAGYRINLSDAVKLALQKSDNTAALVIMDQISPDDFDFVYDGLGVTQAMYNGHPMITAHEYAFILKGLYFSSVLNNSDSEKILEFLTNTDFSDMLPAGIPKGIPVAHKIGVDYGKLYSDCGIVYKPMRPYILCMISKSNLLPARERMKKISAMTYAYISHLK